MRKTISFQVDAPDLFLRKLVSFSHSFPQAAILSSNEWQDSRIDIIAGIDTLDELRPEDDSFKVLKEFYEQKKDWLFGYFSYDLKNEIEKLSSENEDRLGFPSMHFFQPKYVFILKDKTLQVHYPNAGFSESEINNLVNSILHSTSSASSGKTPPLPVRPRVTRPDYLQAISAVKKHIALGDIYEMNYCMEFFSEDAAIDPPAIFLKLNDVSQSPFSAYYKLKDKFLMCASPERFLKKDRRKITSQPIKGTARRGKTTSEDAALKEQLFRNRKDRSENVMIVDLVRNDLSKTCDQVEADELFHVYTFKQWHQMISSVSGEMRAFVHFTDVIKNAFPMGSMTGAPKVKAMELIEQYEKTKRGVFSGAAGYITPEGDFDLNVVIRSILYDAPSHYLSFMVGSAITSSSVAEDEYEECMLKAKGIFETLNAALLSKREKEISFH